MTTDVLDAIDTSHQAWKDHREILSQFGLITYEGDGYIEHEPADTDVYTYCRDLTMDLESQTDYTLVDLFDSPTKRTLLEFFVGRANPHDHHSKGSIMDHTGLSRHTISEHIGVFTETGLVSIDEAPGHPTFYPNVEGWLYNALTELNERLAIHYESATGSLDVR